MAKIYGNKKKCREIPDTYNQSTLLNLFPGSFAHALTFGNWTGSGFLLKKGSVIIEKDSNEQWVRDIKKKLKEDNMLQYNEGLGDYTLCEDIYLHSPSTSAALVLGQNSDGYMVWMDSDGNKLGHLKWPDDPKYF